MTIQHLTESTAEHLPESALIVSFRLGSQQYGLPIAAVYEVVRLPALIILAGADPALCGLLNLRGRYLPVFDGRLLVSEAAGYDVSKQIVIVGGAQPACGLLVDQVDGVVQPGGASSAALARPLAGALIDSVCETAHGSIICLSPTALLALAAEAAAGVPAPAD